MFVCVKIKIVPGKKNAGAKRPRLVIINPTVVFNGIKKKDVIGFGIERMGSMEDLFQHVAGKVVLITGGTGSFGNAMLRKLLKSDCREIRIFSRDEKKQFDMRLLHQNEKRIKFFIGDVRDFNSINSIMSGVNLIFSAAALKQVPSCEFFPLEAVKTNILGTENVLQAAIKNNVENIVVLSTDKAVYPINAMGMTKALMEKVAIATSNSLGNRHPTICVTRYGNVMATRGSVIPLFIDQLKIGSPLTITDPEMTRFMMSLDNAIELVLFAFKNGEPGDTFVQKAPAATILQLATVLKKIFKSSSEIKIIGTRQGEKKHESLLTNQEIVRAVDLDNYFKIPSEIRELNYEKYFKQGRKHAGLKEYTSENTYRLTNDELEIMLLNLDYVQVELDKI